MATGETARFPVDFDALKKGDRIGADVISEWAGVRPTSSRYSGKQVQFRNIIEKALSDRGADVTAACVGSEIVILTDSEAVEYTADLFRAGLRRARRAHHKGMSIDTRNLSDAQRKELDRNIVVQGAMLAGLAAGRREVTRIECQRRTPGLPPPQPAVE